MLIQASWNPIIVQLGSFTLGLHGLFTALAVIVAVMFGVRLIARYGVNPASMENVVIWLLVGGVIGARLFHVLDHLSYYSQHVLQVFAVWEGGIAVYGAFIGGIFAGLIAAKRAGLPLWISLDVGAPAMLIGQAIGRLGCFSNGDAWGAPTGGNWGVVYSNPNDLLPANLIGVPTHPYPLYEIACEIVLLGILYLIWGRVKTPGVKFAIGVLGYAAIRFFLTFFRQEPILIAGLQEAQIIAVLSAVVGVGILVYRLSFAARSKPAVHETTATEV